MPLQNALPWAKKIYLTATHFHPEHSFGAVAFEGQATLVYNESQRTEFIEKRSNYVQFFTRLGMGLLVGETRFVLPSETYDHHLRIDLGGRVVDLYAGHADHTRGDQIIVVPELKAVFLGDLLETDSVPIFSWFPEIDDTDVSSARWLATLEWAAAWNPDIVVPGHGPVGVKADVFGLRDYIAAVRDDVRAMCGSATSVAGLQAELTPKLRALHPDWHLSEWIGPSLNAFAHAYCPTLH